MGSGVSREQRGSFSGTGSLLTVDSVGFRPRQIRLINTASGDEATWTESMADASMYKRVAAGTGAMVTTGGLTPTATGFTLGTDADLNASGEQVLFICVE